MQVSPPPPRWVAVTSTDDFPVAMRPVYDTLEGIAPVRIVPLPFRPLPPEEEVRFADALGGAEGILLRPGYITSTLLDRLPELRVVAVHGAGVDQVDVEACTKRGVWVTNAPGANADSVAEFTLGLVICLLRGIARADEQVRNERVWGEVRHTGVQLRGKSLGVVGLGQVGIRLCRAAGVLGMEVYGCDPMIPEEAIRDRGVSPLGLRNLLETADVVSLHAPLTPETYHLIDREALSRMKPTAFLVNTARGPLVDEEALAVALRTGVIAGAALDVLEGEPPDPGSPIFKAPNLLLTPHMAGSTTECLEAIARVAGEDIARVLSGEFPSHPVNQLGRG